MEIIWNYNFLESIAILFITVFSLYFAIKIILLIWLYIKFKLG